jgi:hypothetical protein
VLAACEPSFREASFRKRSRGFALRVAVEYRLSRRRDPLHKVVSPDGKTMRETFKGTIQGTPIEIVAVLDRQ